MVYGEKLMMVNGTTNTIDRLQSTINDSHSYLECLFFDFNPISIYFLFYFIRFFFYVYIEAFYQSCDKFFLYLLLPPPSLTMCIYSRSPLYVLLKNPQSTSVQFK